MEITPKFLIGLLYVVIGQFLVWFQTSAQFIWPKAKEYTLWLSLTIGIAISYCFIKGVGIIAEASNGEIWPSRIIPSVTGTVIFAFMTWLLLNQGINAKTAVCLCLSFIIICIQIFWK